MHKIVFTIDGFQHPHIGYTSGRLWNGWATPFFEVDEALAVMEEYNSCHPDFPMVYDAVTDTFFIDDTESKVFEEWKGENLKTDEEIKHLYGIGAYSWIWEYITEDEVKAIAQRVEEFTYEFDTYEYMNTLGTDRDYTVGRIAEQLKSHDVLKKVVLALYVEDLTEEELFNKLGEVLKL